MPFLYWQHKIIPTILSRCQIFDFNRIKIEDTVKYLERISRKENITYEPDAFTIIARKADGAMRDALSIFDQVVSFSGSNITYQGVINNLNVLDYEYYFRLTDSFLESNVAGALLIFDTILDKGFDAHNFIVGLSNHFRDLLVCKDPSTQKLLEAGASIREKYLAQAHLAPDSFIFEALSILSNADITFKSSKNQRLHVELALVKIARVLKKKTDDLTTDDVVQEEKQQLSGYKSQVSQPVQTKSAVSDKTENPQKPFDKEKYGYSSATVSIKGLNSAPAVKKEDQRVKIQETPISGNRKKEFSLEELNHRYTEFVESLKDDRPRIFSSLSIIKPSLENLVIKLEMNNSGLVEDFNREFRQSLLNFLKKTLENDFIDIEVAVSATGQKTKLYTNDEKYNYLLTKNPNLQKLKQKFNLDFE